MRAAIVVAALSTFVAPAAAAEDLAEDLGRLDRAMARSAALAALAEQRGASARVRRLGALLRADHDEHRRRLARLAAAHGASLAAVPPADTGGLERLAGTAFDQAVVRALIDAHQETDALIGAARAGGLPRPLRAALRDLARLEAQHLEVAVAVFSRLGIRPR